MHVLNRLDKQTSSLFIPLIILKRKHYKIQNLGSQDMLWIRSQLYRRNLFSSSPQDLCLVFSLIQKDYQCFVVLQNKLLNAVERQGLFVSVVFNTDYCEIVS